LTICGCWKRKIPFFTPYSLSLHFLKSENENTYIMQAAKHDYNTIIARNPQKKTVEENENYLTVFG